MLGFTIFTQKHYLRQLLPCAKNHMYKMWWQYHRQKHHTWLNLLYHRRSNMGNESVACRDLVMHWLDAPDPNSSIEHWHRPGGHCYGIYHNVSL